MMQINIWTILRRFVTGAAVVYLLAPLIIVAILSLSSAPFLTFPPPGFSLRWYYQIWSDPDWSSSIVTSILITVPTAIIATAIGTGAAIAACRCALPAAAALSGLIMLPLIIPIIVAAAAISGAFGALGLQGTYSGLILAHIVLSIPYVFSVVRASLQTLNSDVEGAALTLGATPARTLFRVTLPMILPSILSGFLFAAVMSFGELVISMFLSSPMIRPVSVQMWSNVRGSVDPTIAAVATSIFLFTVFVLILEHVINRRSRS
ncbi:ABC transporter permease [Sphingobium sp. H39-3-25]|uniref:ABC transporter permease n=1 Tax=Sphingobium arseniciresistens TaxID=3030834 RepID=UPI0023B96C90|nr:ABC transporter permease [Sphingobium arseniciresistens]